MKMKDRAWRSEITISTGYAKKNIGPWQYYYLSSKDSYAPV